MPIDLTMGMVRGCSTERRWGSMRTAGWTALVDSIAWRRRRAIAVGRLLLLGPATSRRHDRPNGRLTFVFVSSIASTGPWLWLQSLLLLLLLPWRIPQTLHFFLTHTVSAEDLFYAAQQDDKNALRTKNKHKKIFSNQSSFRQPI